MNCSVLPEELARGDVLQGDGEARFEVGIRSGRGCEAVSQPQLLHRLSRGVRGHLVTARDDASPKDVSLEMHASLEALSEKARNGRLAGRHRPGDQIHDGVASVHATSVRESGQTPRDMSFSGIAAAPDMHGRGTLPLAARGEGGERGKPGFPR